MTAITRRRLVWAITGVEIVLLAWLVFAVHCPARLELERMGAVPPDRLHPAVRGEARCWTIFLIVSGLLLAFSALVSSAMRRQEIRPANDERMR